MPELPEVETVRISLLPAIGAQVTSAWDSGKGLHMQKKPPRAKLKHLVGAHISAMRRHGKYLLVDFDNGLTLLVHLGMTGQVRLRPVGTPLEKHAHVVLGLGTRDLVFVDARRFGQIDRACFALGDRLRGFGKAERGQRARMLDRDVHGLGSLVA